AITTLSLYLSISFVSLGGIISNIFIFALNVKDCRRKRLSSCDILVSSIAFSNILFQCLAAVFCSSAVLWDDFYTSDGIISAMTVTCFFLRSFSLWFSALLCADYCIKIINNNQAYFLWLKVTLPKNVPWLGCGAAVVSLVTSLTAIFDHSFSMKKIPAPGNTTMLVYINTKPKCNCFYAIYLLSTSLAFALCFTSVISILVSLYKHVRRMKRSSENNNAHLTAAKTLTALLLLYIYFFAAVSYLFNISSIGTNPVFFYCLLMISSFPLLNALILIMGNPKLRTSLKNLLLTLLWIYWVII
uniref:Taste receptor type 2 n=1 Tax=Leptobrachium leishanense TaxID=445787 RepID=A0A8C5R8Q5_9ANUR